MTNSSETEVETADSLMARLQADAERSGDPRPVATLRRLVQACNDLQSGTAHKMAKAGREAFAAEYDPRFMNLKARLVGHYVAYRMRNGSSDWTGPHEVSIRRKPDWMLYLRLRQEEARPANTQRTRTNAARRLDEMVDRIPDMHERDQIQAAVSRGRDWKSKYDVLVQACRGIPEIDVDLLIAGKRPKRDVEAPVAQSVMGPDDTRVMQTLVRRLQDTNYLEEMELVFRSGRVKMAFGQMKDLVTLEEMRLLQRLAGFENTGAQQ